MDEWVLLILAVLAFPAMVIVSFVLSLTHRSRIRVLEARVAALEMQALGAMMPGPQAAGAAAPPEAAPTLAPAAPPAVADVSRPPPIPDPPATSPPIHAPVTPGRAADGPPPAFDPARLKERLSGFEEKVGARWAVWVGGIALALGGVFLVRFAVEQDLIGPAARVGLGLALAVLLLAGGEWLRRHDRRDDFAGLPAAHVPSVLTAAGTMTAFGSVFAAYELYHLVSPQLAFLLLALVGIATLLAALLHGPALAALGFVGAAVTPFLVTTSEPDAWGVALLIAVVAASALGVARVRRWVWLALLAIAGVVAWGLTLLAFEVPQGVAASGGLGLVLLALTAALLAPGLLWGPPADERPDPVSSAGAIGGLAVAAAAAVAGHLEAMPLAVFVVACLGVLALSWRVGAATFAAVAVAVLAPALLTQWVFPPEPGAAVAPGGPVAGVVPEPVRLSLGHFMAYGFGLGVLLLGLGFAGSRRSRRGLLAVGWAVAGSLGPVLMLVAAYGKLAGFDRNLPFAALALALAFAFTLAAERLTGAGRRHAATVFAAGAVVSLCLALTFALEKGWLTVSLALAALGVAWVSTRRPLPGLRRFSAGLALVVLARIIWLPTIAGVSPGATPLFNWLLWGYGVPAAAFAGAAFLLRDRDDWSRRVHECLALVFAVLLAAFQVRHLAHGGDVYAPGTRLFESGLMASIYGAYAVGLARLAAVTGRGLYRIFCDLVAVLAGLSAMAGLTGNNPFQTGGSVGGPVFNDLLLAYALPAALALGFAALQPPERGKVRIAAQALAVLLGLAYLAFEVSRLFQGPVLRADAITSAEWYAYSAAWLVFGILLLGLGLWRGARTLRLASAAVMVVTVLKVFLSDMADLEGVLRAVSFIGLGLVLVAMGWLYQRLLGRSRPGSQAGA
ncbi:DUF2339 domain-containing protein [Xanthobacter sp. AM11]|uniref:DUF2339 domain-containing protein n=1 Tax=Xanthobacter sp. AM11 TaxID=3380643 RepID=UPI0039BF1F08